MSPNGFDKQQSSHDLSPDSRLSLLLLETQRRQQQAKQALKQVPPLLLADIAAQQRGQMPWETVGEWSLIPSKHPSSSSQLPMVTEQDSRELKKVIFTTFCFGSPKFCKHPYKPKFWITKCHGGLTTNER